MGQYTAPLRDMQFVLHELLNVEAELKSDADARRPRRRTPSTRFSRKPASSAPTCCSR